MVQTSSRWFSYRLAGFRWLAWLDKHVHPSMAHSHAVDTLPNSEPAPDRPVQATWPPVRPVLRGLPWSTCTTR